MGSSTTLDLESSPYHMLCSKRGWTPKICPVIFEGGNLTLGNLQRRPRRAGD